MKLSRFRLVSFIGWAGVQLGALFMVMYITLGNDPATMRAEGILFLGVILHLFGERGKHAIKSAIVGLGIDDIEEDRE